MDVIICCLQKSECLQRNNFRENHATFAGSSSRRGSRPYLSPDERPDTEGSLGSAGTRSTRSTRRDSLSPDSANEEGKIVIFCPQKIILFFSAQWRVQRRDSRPLLSPEPDCPRSRDGSPRRSGGSGRGIGRRRSSGKLKIN